MSRAVSERPLESPWGQSGEAGLLKLGFLISAYNTAQRMI